jgi:hypothetical protein
MPSLDAIAASRAACREHLPSSRPLSSGYERVGVAGEIWLRRFIGAPEVGHWTRPEGGGDGGTDLVIRCRMPTGNPRNFRVDVKTARKPFNLIVEEGKVQADLYILLRYSDEAEACFPVGWEWASVMRRMPTKDFGYGVVNHYRHHTLLRKMDELQSRLIYGAWRVEE